MKCETEGNSNGCVLEIILHTVSSFTDTFNLNAPFVNHYEHFTYRSYFNAPHVCLFYAVSSELEATV